MNQANAKPPPAAGIFRGLEQFPWRGQTGDIGYCVARATPYALEFTNDSDVICLLLGDIFSETEFDADGRRSLLFAGRSAAFHPRGGRIRVQARDVRHGFIAFSYLPRFQEILDDAGIGRVRRGGSQVNIRRESLRYLAQYALARLRTRAPFGLFETQSLASLVYIETIRSLGEASEPRRRNLSHREFAAVCAIIDAELGSSLTCAQIAAAANIPLRAIFDGIKLRTGMSLYRFVTERRLARARELLLTSAASIAEIALACGFSSQQHLTSVFSDKIGQTPLQIRRQA